MGVLWNAGSREDRKLPAGVKGDYSPLAALEREFQGAFNKPVCNTEVLRVAALPSRLWGAITHALRGCCEARWCWVAPEACGALCRCSGGVGWWVR